MTCLMADPAVAASFGGDSVDVLLVPANKSAEVNSASPSIRWSTLTYCSIQVAGWTAPALIVLLRELPDEVRVCFIEKF